ncbi:MULTISPECIES: transcriptional regulator NrdR [unclassified Enterococcus]|uniref:transcriptional regulator NrdR n=1 Tax=unclassified Enterococcus TaxID=2608891 RepID=UPI0015517564|nr:MULTISPECIES: transcriptional regulator NrdR [unclassified Enterococcus]MBS7576688.1 transcriptional regulator NrdR [Enterococcus sp. MMGLQ5-2]MBS7583825.1 transcriptional regulator NrdR [Enterococcus sp. MMGLQ5-1]NPD11686.1 transcriptional repressor NrdR [Enterococcus sp. MMGLQ5-1]NPD36525.1 transcriptional repressor NrdR [Enterococcus sp. MMGLQ5-2]
MKCPKCKDNRSKVVDSRQLEDGGAIRRRRECENCGFRFTTFERIEQTPLLVVKKNGEREEFKREKILRGIVRSAEKRSISMDQMTEIVDKVEKKVLAIGENEISTNQVGEYVMEELAKVDEVAYIRFASVYRQFKDMSVFLEELEDMMQQIRNSNNNDSSKLEKNKK